MLAILSITLKPDNRISVIIIIILNFYLTKTRLFQMNVSIFYIIHKQYKQSYEQGFWHSIKIYNVNTEIKPITTLWWLRTHQRFTPNGFICYINKTERKMFWLIMLWRVHIKLVRRTKHPVTNFRRKSKKTFKDIKAFLYQLTGKNTCFFPENMLMREWKSHNPKSSEQLVFAVLRTVLCGFHLTFFSPM